MREETERAWQEYLAAERVRVRADMMAALDRFLAAMDAEPDDERRAWALALARAIVDDGVDIPVRMPLFRRLLLPALVGAILACEPGSARRLASFGMQLYHARDDMDALPERLRSPGGLLEEAVRQDPADRASREKLASLEAGWLDYAIHEVPSGVLYGPDESIDELLALLDEFRLHIHVLGWEERYQKLVDDCDFHFHAYREYVTAGCPFGSYAAFLEQRRLA